MVTPQRARSEDGNLREVQRCVYLSSVQGGPSDTSPVPVPCHRLPEATGLFQRLREHHRVPDVLPRGDRHLLSLLPRLQTRRLGVRGVLTQPHLVVQPAPVPFSGR